MSLTVTFAHAPPDWTHPLTFRAERDIIELLQKLGWPFLKNHPELHAELIRARWAIRRTP